MDESFIDENFQFRIIFRLYEYLERDYVYICLNPKYSGSETDLFEGKKPPAYISNLKLSSIPPYTKIKELRLRLG
jgi:hypothetical protein